VEYAIALTIFQAFNNLQVMFLLMCDKYKIINVQQNAEHLRYKYHRLFVNFSVLIIVKRCLKFLSIH